MVVALMLTAQRLNRLLNKADDWRIGKPFSVMLLSNFLTCLVTLPAIAVIAFFI